MKEIIISIKEIQTNKTIVLRDLELEDLFEDILDANDLIFNSEHYSNNNKSIRLLECGNCRLGGNLYLLVFNEKMTMFIVDDTNNIIVNENKIKLFGWDSKITIYLKNGKIKETEIR